MKIHLKFLSLLGFFLIFSLAFFSCSDSGDDRPNNTTITTITPIVEEEEGEYEDNIETFEFLSNGETIKGKVYLPEAYLNGNKDLPVIYLIDVIEEKFQVAKDEFERVIDATIHHNIDVIIVSNSGLFDIPTWPYSDFDEKYMIYRDMAIYIDATYNNNNIRTLIGRGTGGAYAFRILFEEDPKTAMFHNCIATDPPKPERNIITDMVINNKFPQEKGNKKFYFSYSILQVDDGLTSFINAINEKNYDWLTFKVEDQADDTFETNYPRAYKNGIRFVFND